MNQWQKGLQYLASTVMQVSLTIIRYPKIFIPFAFVGMAIHRLPLWLNKNIRFYKLLGCGKNGTFDKVPDLQQWGVLLVHSSEFIVESTVLDSNLLFKRLHGSFITDWFRVFGCETFTILLEPIEGHGLWDSKEVFGNLPGNSSHTGSIAILTRATIRFNKLKYFWQHVAAVSEKMATANGFITSLGIGEVPWIKQGTFSVWQSKEDMMAFAYGMKEHTEVIKKTREQQWYSEEMFVRFRIIGYCGSISGKDPLKGKL